MATFVKGPFINGRNRIQIDSSEAGRAVESKALALGYWKHRLAGERNAISHLQWESVGKSLMLGAAPLQNVFQNGKNHMTQNIEGKVVVITGASSGLGEASAKLLARQGAKLVLGARRIDRLQALARELQLDDQAVMQTDVTDRAQVQRLVDRAVQLHGRVDVMLNNAGLMPSAMLEKLHVDEWDRMIDVNIKGVLYGVAAALPVMQAQKSGHFINVASVAGHKVGPGGTVYAATKHAVRVISEGLRQEVKPYNIRTTIVSPGAVATELIDTITDPEVAAGMRKTYEQAIPAESFARVVAFAMSQPEEVDINEVLFRPTSQAY